MTFQRGQSDSAKSSGSSVLGSTTTWSQRSRPWRPAGVLLDVVAQGVAGFAGLADGLDGVLAAAAFLPPAVAVVPDLAALDLQADDAGALDGDDEVDLVILEVVGDALARDDEVVGLELVDERLVDAALGAVGEPRSVGGGDGHRRVRSLLRRNHRMSTPPL